MDTQETQKFLMDISAGLRTAHTEQAANIFTLWKLRRQIEERISAIMPAQGWEGKNAELREQAQRAAVAADPKMKELQQLLEAATEAESRYGAMIESLSDQRRAMEWVIRLEIVDVLRGKENSRKADPTEHVFEAAQDAQALDTALALPGAALQPSLLPDDLP